MTGRQCPELRLRLARGYSHLTPSALDAEPVNVLLAKSVTVRVQSEAIRSIGFSGLLPAPLLFCHDKIGKKGQKNEKKAQFIWNIVDKFTSWANGITLNNVNGIKNILINLERPAKQTAFHYRDITDCFRKEIQKKSGKDPVIISCIKDDCKIAGRHGPSLKQIRYRQKPAEIY
jgi:hypothetical protein